MPAQPYLQLMRLHQPVGIWLLLWPCWWAYALASLPSLPSLLPMLLFAIGAVAMRGAGCIVNDIIDRDIDAQVERTRTRPLASGALSVRQALVALVLLITIGFATALLLGWKVVIGAALALPLIVIYPMMKRVTWWPQLFLGITFNWGVWLGWLAAGGVLTSATVIFYIGCVFWTLGYDTIYAHQDKRDDARIGVRSTALRLGSETKRFVYGFYGITILCIVLTGLLLSVDWPYYLGIAAFGAHLGWQIGSVNLDDPASCRRVFVSNAQAGWLLLVGIIFSSVLG